MRKIVAVLAITAWARIAAADTATDEAAAREHYHRATTFFSLGEFAAAISEYKAAFTLVHDPVLLYNIAQAYRLANDPSHALFFYKSFLSNQPNADNRKEVEDRIKKLEEQVAQQRVPGAAPPASTQTSTVLPSPQPSSEMKPAPAAEAKPAAATLASTAVVATKSAPKAAQPVYKKWWLWTAVGVGVAAIAVGAGVGVARAGSSAPSTSFGNTAIY